MTGQKVEEIIKETVEKTLSDRNIPDLKELIYTDNIGEVIEKLCILHIRMWMIEDQLGLAKTDEEIAVSFNLFIKFCILDNMSCSFS